MAIISLNPDAVREYSLTEDVGPEKTVFLLGALDAFTLNQIALEARVRADQSEDEEEKKSKNLTILGLFVMYGLRGWNNFRDGAGKAIAHETEMHEVGVLGPRPVLKRDLLRHFSLMQIAELAGEIQANSVLSKQERGN